MKVKRTIQLQRKEEHLKGVEEKDNCKYIVQKYSACEKHHRFMAEGPILEINKL